MSGLLFLVECGPRNGIGHLRRMLALAAPLAERADCTFALSHEMYADMVGAQGHHVVAWHKKDVGIVDAYDAVLIDGYDYDSALLAKWRDRLPRFVMDDMADRPLEAELILNHNLYGEACDYSAYRWNKLLVGPRYALISDAFAALRDMPRPQAPHVLISFGGTDEGQFSAPLANTLRKLLPDAVLDVALLREPRAEWRSSLMASATLHIAMPLERLMGKASVYVGAAGFTLLEAITVGLSPIVCGIAGNQEMNVLASRALGLSAFDRFDPAGMAVEAVKLYGKRSRLAVPGLDGKGARRVADVLMSAIVGPSCAA